MAWSLLHRVLAHAVLSLALAGCATWQAPAGIDDSALRARATTANGHDVRVSAVVVGEETSQQMFGPDIEKANVLPIWIEVENRSPQPLWLLRSGTDPDYFSPLEVAWSMHKTLAGGTNASIDDHVQGLCVRESDPARRDARGGRSSSTHRAGRRCSTSICSAGRRWFPSRCSCIRTTTTGQRRSRSSIRRRRSPTTTTSTRCARRSSGCRVVRPMQAGRCRATR